MPERNRVTPLGDIEAFPLRGAWTGNRGVLHEGHEIVRFHASNLWIACALQFRDYGREQWLPRRWTHLFFHDEAVAFAAGHRPCCECRRAAYVAYRDRFPDPSPSAQQMNRVLHGERIVRGTHRRRLHDLPVAGLPDGTFVLLDGVPALVLDQDLVEWTREGYRDRRSRPVRGTLPVLTPPATVAVLRAGYPVQIDTSAGTILSGQGAERRNGLSRSGLSARLQTPDSLHRDQLGRHDAPCRGPAGVPA